MLCAGSDCDIQEYENDPPVLWPYAFLACCLFFPFFLLLKRRKEKKEEELPDHTAVDELTPNVAPKNTAVRSYLVAAFAAVKTPRQMPQFARAHAAPSGRSSSRAQ